MFLDILGARYPYVTSISHNFAVIPISSDNLPLASFRGLEMEVFDDYWSAKNEKIKN